MGVQAGQKPKRSMTGQRTIVLQMYHSPQNFAMQYRRTAKSIE